MAKNPKTPKHDEEYKFAEEMEHQFEAPQKPPRRNLLKMILSNRKFILVIGVLLAVLVVYQFIGKTTPIKQEIAEVTQPKLEQKPEVTPTPSLTVTAPVIPADETQQQIQALVAQGQQNQQQMQQLQANMQQLQSSVTQLGNQPAPACPQVAAPSPAPVKVVQPVVIKAQPKVPFYTVRAVVPGRAWLQEKKNNHIIKLLTVRVGDYLPGYGRVQAISPRDGKVWTSWGNVIRYGANDS